MKGSLIIEQFTERARRRLGNKYDYSKTIYTKNYNKITITCPISSNLGLGA